jgi:cyclopropane-fatty-acyl-phospholipid synthase
VLSTVLGAAELPVRVRAWDGSEAGPADAPLLVVGSPQALRRILWSPNELGLARAYVAGEIDLPGDLFAALAALTSARLLAGTGQQPSPPGVRERWRLLTRVVALGAVGREPPPPPEEVDLARQGRRHSGRRDAAAIAHHYDLSNDFYALVLGPSLVYSCAVWEDERIGLEAAQAAKIDLVCRKLDLQPGMRVLDVGCGWGSFALHAAERYGVDVVGITLSAAQATLARKRVTSAGLDGSVDIRVQDYRELDDGPFDAISSIGMAEHVGRAEIGGYANRLHDLLRPGGRLLNHAIAWNAGYAYADPNTFIARYVFPDAEILNLGETIGALQSADLEILDVEALRRHYALTLRAWAQRLEDHWTEAVRLVGESRARVWRLYLAGSALAFETGKEGVNQVLVQRPGGAEPPLRRTAWI